MKLYPPIYPGDSMLRPGTVAGGSIVSAWEALAFRAQIVRSNMHVSGALEPSIDMVAIEQGARAARSAWIGKQLSYFYQALARKF